ncbi:hypothetical protein NDU88_002080 [Pleurodeles waltl]|uniref:Uncharacterized protein n=1 Tax=Pleurodeles waltl TaxID=8319 RepID=A0AAV7P5T5_PLEWA|nr:hypothetical protein NDU88_002080 [Pleurodeles waltl]
MGQAGPSCRGHQLATIRQYEQPGPLPPHLQSFVTLSGLAGLTKNSQVCSRPDRPQMDTCVRRLLPGGPTRPRTLPTGSSLIAPEQRAQSSGGLPVRHSQSFRKCRRGLSVPRKSPQVQPRLTLCSQGARRDRASVPCSWSPGVFPYLRGGRPPPKDRASRVLQSRSAVFAARATPLHAAAPPRGPVLQARLTRTLLSSAACPQRVHSRPQQVAGPSGLRFSRQQGDAAPHPPQITKDNLGATRSSSSSRPSC